jgi:hypothetical protein
MRARRSVTAITGPCNKTQNIAEARFDPADEAIPLSKIEGPTQRGCLEWPQNHPDFEMPRRVIDKARRGFENRIFSSLRG